MGHLQRGHNPILHRSAHAHVHNRLAAWLCQCNANYSHRTGRLNQAEYSERIDPIISSQHGDKEHLHNQLLAALYANVTREMPDQGLAPWVSANDKPAIGTGTKPVSGDATERRLKGQVMQLPSRDRRRIKDIQQNDVCTYAPARHIPAAYGSCAVLTPYIAVRSLRVPRGHLRRAHDQVKAAQAGRRKCGQQRPEHEYAGEPYQDKCTR